MASAQPAVAEEARLTPPLRVLIVEDDGPHAEAIAESLERVGYECHVVTSGTDAVKRIESEAFHLVVTDLSLGDVDGLHILKRTKEQLPDAEVILVTGHGTVPSAVAAMQQGAFDYLEKPLDLKKLRGRAENASEMIRLRWTNAELNRRLDERFGFEGVVGTSRQMNEVIERLQRIAPTDASVLILGDTGTGKELVAQAIHQNSPRKKKRFVALNCAALSENILESELFGHVKGAFTDAATDRVGKFEYAHGGTLFLDEVGDMPLTTQSKLLRVIESGEITRLGANDPICVNVRILSATNRDLEEAVASRTFRPDLYHRLKVVTVDLPRLADRTQDIPLLIDHFTKQLAKRHHKTIKGTSTAARRRLIAFDFPGNVRQLRNIVESMVVVDADEFLDTDDLPSELSPRHDDVARVAPSGVSGLAGKSLSEIERMAIAETLALTGGNREEASAMLGIGERTLYRKIKEYQL